eukprot:96078_1
MKFSKINNSLFIVSNQKKLDTSTKYRICKLSDSYFEIESTKHVYSLHRLNTNKNSQALIMFVEGERIYSEDKYFGSGINIVIITARRNIMELTIDPLHINQYYRELTLSE